MIITRRAARLCVQHTLRDGPGGFGTIERGRAPTCVRFSGWLPGKGGNDAVGGTDSLLHSLRIAMARLKTAYTKR